MITVVTYWDQFPEAHVEALLKALAKQTGKTKAREHPMPGYVPPKRETYTPDRVLQEFFKETGGTGGDTLAAYRTYELTERLKKHGYIIAT